MSIIEGETITLDVDPNETIREAVKDTIFETVGVPTELQRLVFGGKQLEAEKTLLEYV